jgi:indole-3-glycerol phosphate synthase
MSAQPDLLGAIMAAAQRRVADQRARVSMADIERAAASRPAPAGAFATALSTGGRVNVIAECKRRSPSRGVLRWEYDPSAIAAGYERAGAAAISVLTEPGFFDGRLGDLTAVAAAVKCPVLRKDFIVDEYQILEARAAGASAVLLIVAGLGDGELRRLFAAAGQMGVDALVEVHDELELKRALAIGATVVGVNNRNLKTLAVDVEAAQRLAPLMPDGVVRVAESGLRTGADVRTLSAAGYHAFLIGERFMSTEDPGAALSGIITEASTPAFTATDTVRSVR